MRSSRFQYLLVKHQKGRERGFRRLARGKKKKGKEKGAVRQLFSSPRQRARAKEGKKRGDVLPRTCREWEKKKKRAVVRPLSLLP